MQMVLFILLITLATAYSGAELISKDVCSGESVILFETVSLDLNDTVLSLYENGDNYTLIATLTITNPKIASKYTGKVFLDQERNVWIQNVNTGDEAKYIMLQETGGTSRNQYEVKLFVLVAPTTNCKPTIKRVDNTLIASLQGNECGKPAASVEFVHFADTSYENSTVAILYPEQETRTYATCMKTPALRCGRFSNPFDFCTYYIFHNNPKNQEGSSQTNVIILSVVFPTCLVLYIVGEYFLRRQCRRRDINESTHNAQDSQQGPVNGEQELDRMVS